MPHNLKQILSSSRGMSLVEIIVVMAIMSVVMFAVMSLYIPAHQSTVAQTQVTDVQDNLRLATTRMSQDLMMAGFLVSGAPVIFDLDAPADNQDFTIRTRLVGSGFGRVTAAAGAGPVVLTMSKADMVDHFPVNSKVRLLNPVASRECGVEYDESDTVAAKNHVYTVTDTDKVARTVTVNTGGVVVVGEIPEESVLVKVANDSQPPLQTIRYRFNNGALERIINGDTQFLARNVSDVNFLYSYTPGGRVHAVDITLTGQTRALKNDTISGAKTRQLRTSVTLRNVF